MARTTQSTGPKPKIWIATRKTATSKRKMNEFELTMRKYYPKRSRFLYQDLDYQASDASNYEHANRRVFQRYKRSFFRTFAGDASYRTPQPSKLPNHLQCLKIYEAPKTFLKKLMKQNKNLKHIVIESECKKTIVAIVRYLKYLKSLCSITFKDFFPYLMKTDCQKMLKTWGKTLEKFSSLGVVEDKFWHKCASFKRVMETILKFPNLKRFKLEIPISMEKVGKYFPFDKLQERNIASEIGLVAGSETWKSLKKNYPQFKITGLVAIHAYKYYLMLDDHKFKQFSNQTLFLRSPFRKWAGLVPIFENISALDLTIHGTRWIPSEMGQLNSLKHLGINLIDEGDADTFGDLFEYLNENVACHKKLETFMIRLCESRRARTKPPKPNGKAILKFFELCSENLRTVHLEFQYPNEEFMDFEYFYEALSKLKNLQTLSLILDFKAFNSKKKIEELCGIISEIKSLEKLDFKIQKREYQEKKINLKFPLQLKQLSFGMNTSDLLFDPSKTLWSLPNLTHLELEFSSFSSQKWKNLIQSTLERLNLLESFTIKRDKELKKIK